MWDAWRTSEIVPTDFLEEEIWSREGKWRLQANTARAGLTVTVFQVLLALYYAGSWLAEKVQLEISGSQKRGPKPKHVACCTVLKNESCKMVGLWLKERRQNVGSDLMWGNVRLRPPLGNEWEAFMIIAELGSNDKSLFHGGNDRVKFPFLFAFIKVK